MSGTMLTMECARCYIRRRAIEKRGGEEIKRKIFFTIESLGGDSKTKKNCHEDAFDAHQRLI